MSPIRFGRSREFAAGIEAARRAGERIRHAHPPILLPVVQIFGVDGVGSQSLRRRQNGGVPIVDGIGLGQLNGDLHQRAVNGLTRKSRPLLDPVQGFPAESGPRRLPYHRHKEFLQDLSRGAKVLGFNQIKGAFLFASVFAGCHRRAYQDVGVEENPSGHAALPGSRFLGRAALGIACSIVAVAPERDVRGPGVQQGS